MSMDSWFGYFARRSAIQSASLDICVAESRSKYTPITLAGPQASTACGLDIATDASRPPSTTYGFWFFIMYCRSR